MKNFKIHFGNPVKNISRYPLEFPKRVFKYLYHSPLKQTSKFCSENPSEIP